MEKIEKAENDYMAGMKYKDIAEKYGTTINTVKSWKKRYGWSRKEGAHKKEKGCTQKIIKVKVAPVQPEDGTRETLQNEELTEEQRLFCIYYSRTYNATQSYLKAYGCDYTTANVNGSRLLVKASIKNEIERLKEIKRQQIVADEADIVELQMRIAFSDIGNYLKFGEDRCVCLEESDRVDTQLIKEIKQEKYGISVKMEDRQKAIDWLSKYFLMHPESRYRAEYEKNRAEKEGADKQEYESDGFLEELKEGTAELFKKADELIET